MTIRQASEMEKCALIIIDMQKAYFRDPILKKAKQALVSRCNEILAAARLHHIPVWNVVTEHASDQSTWTLNMTQDNQGFLLRGSDETRVLDELEMTGARTIVKTRDSAFYNTTLADELHAERITKLILCGVSTQSCVAQTAANAYAANFEVILAREAIATNDPGFHQVILKLLEKEYRQTLADNKEILALMTGAVIE